VTYYYLDFECVDDEVITSFNYANQIPMMIDSDTLATPFKHLLYTTPTPDQLETYWYKRTMPGGAYEGAFSTYHQIYECTPETQAWPATISMDLIYGLTVYSLSILAFSYLIKLMRRVF